MIRLQDGCLRTMGHGDQGDEIEREGFSAPLCSPRLCMVLCSFAIGLQYPCPVGNVIQRSHPYRFLS